jgi:hypothetical protein
VKSRLPQSLAHERLHKLQDGRVVNVGAEIESHEAWSLERAGVMGEVLFLDIAGEQIAHLLGDVRADRFRVRHDDGHAGAGRASGDLRADLCKGLFNGVCAQPDLNRVHLRAGHREHERGGVPEVAVERNRPCTLRQVRDAVQLEVDVVKLLLCICDIFPKLDSYDRDAGEGD